MVQPDLLWRAVLMCGGAYTGSGENTVTLKEAKLKFVVYSFSVGIIIRIQADCGSDNVKL